MLSLKRTMEAMGAVEDRLKAWSGGYTSVLQAMETAAESLAAEECRPFQQEVREAGATLVPDAAPEAVTRASTDIQTAIEKFAGDLVTVRTRQEKEFKRIIRIAAEAASAMARSGNTHSEEITQFADRISTSASLQSVVELRREMASWVTELKVVAHRIQADTRERAKLLEHDLATVQERLKAAEVLAETDVLTKLGNRLKLERTMELAIREGIQFSVVLLDLDGFKIVNDRFGHHQGDHLLKALAAQLSKHVRESDSIGRWGGDEFVIVMRHIGCEAAEHRATQLHAKIFGEFMLETQGRTARVQVTASMGVAEHSPGETADEVFEHADRMLYAQKRRRYESRQLIPA